MSTKEPSLQSKSFMYSHKQKHFFLRRTCKNKIDKTPSHHHVQYTIQKWSICRSMALNKSSISAETLPRNLYQRTFLAISIMHYSHNQKQFLFFSCDEHAKARLIRTQVTFTWTVHTHMCVYPIIWSHICIDISISHTWTVHRHWDKQRNRVIAKPLGDLKLFTSSSELSVASSHHLSWTSSSVHPCLA